MLLFHRTSPSARGIAVAAGGQSRGQSAGPTRRARARLALAALALVPWAAAVFAFGAGSSGVGAVDQPVFHSEHLTLAVQRPDGLYYVEIAMLVGEQQGSDYAAELAAARADMLARFPGCRGGGL